MPLTLRYRRLRLNPCKSALHTSAGRRERDIFINISAYTADSLAICEHLVPLVRLATLFIMSLIHIRDSETTSSLFILSSVHIRDSETTSSLFILSPVHTRFRNHFIIIHTVISLHQRFRNHFIIIHTVISSHQIQKPLYH